MKNVFLAFLLLAVSAVANADSLPLYTVSGEMTFTSGVYSEVMDFSFGWQYLAGGGFYSGSVIPGSGSFSSSGSLGSDSVTGFTPGFDSSGSYFTVGGAAGSEFLSFISVGRLEDSPLPPQLLGAQMWGCQTQTCLDEFAGYNTSLPLLAPIMEGTLAYTVVDPPPLLVYEPSVLVLLLAGILFFLVTRKP